MDRGGKEIQQASCTENPIGFWCGLAHGVGAGAMLFRKGLESKLNGASYGKSSLSKFPCSIPSGEQASHVSVLRCVTAVFIRDSLQKISWPGGNNNAAAGQFMQEIFAGPERF